MHLQDIVRAFEAVETQMKSLEQSGSQYKPEDNQVNSVREFYKKGGKGNKYDDRAIQAERNWDGSKMLQ